MKRVILLVLATSGAFLFNGCAAKTSAFGYDQPVEAFSSDTKNKNATAPIVVDFIDFISCQYPPAQTTFLIDPEHKTVFTSNIEVELRKYGYAITYKQIENAVPLAWKIDTFDKNRIRVTFIIGGGNVSRQYIFSGGIYYPIGVFTALNFEKTCNNPVLPPHKPIIMQPIIEQKQDVKSKPQAQTSSPNSSKYQGIVKVATYLQIHKEPNLKSKIIGKLIANTELFFSTVVKADKLEWIKLDSINGYVAGNYVVRKEAI